MTIRVIRLSRLLFYVKLVLLYFSCELSAESCKAPSQVSKCPEGWELSPRPRSCILRLKQRLTWQDGRDACHKKNSELLVVTTKEMNKFMYEHAVEHTYEKIWIGMIYLQKEKVWQWDQENLTRPQNYTNWSREHPRPEDRKYCTVAQESGGWISQDCNSRYYFLCEYTKKEDDSCRKGWVVAHAITRCVRSPLLKLNYSDAKLECRKDNAHVMTIRDERENFYIHTFLVRYQMVWMGLNDIAKESNWVWLSGLKMADTDWKKWANDQPDGGWSENCVSFAFKGEWYDIPCDSLHGVVCQMEARDKPGNTQVHVNYHRPDNTAYLDTPLKMTCTADYTKKNVAWSLSKKNGELEALTNHSIKNEFVVTKNKNGQCVDRTISTLNIMATKDLDGAEFSCHSRMKKTKRKCRNYSPTVKPCAITAPINVVDGPKSPPNMTIFYDGKPGKGRVKEDQQVTVNCSANVGAAGILTWVVYFDHGPKIIPNYDRTRVPIYDMSRESGITDSSLQFKIMEHLSGISVACFSYDVAKFNTNMSCLESDNYCAVSPPFKIFKTKTKGSSALTTLSYIMLIIFLMMVLTAIATKYKIEAEEEGISDVQDYENLPALQQDVLNQDVELWERTSQKKLSAEIPEVVSRVSAGKTETEEQ